MKTSGFLFMVTVIVVIISLLCIWFYPSIQDFMESNNMWNGINNFDREFNATGVDSLDEINDLAAGTALISIPYLDYNDEDLAKIKRFVDRGGMLLVMDDYGFGNRILASFGKDVRFSNRPLLDPLFCFKNQWMPRVVDFSPAVKAAGIEVLMLNHATALTNAGNTEVAAWSSGASFLDLDESESRGPGEPEGPFPVAVSFESGRGKVVAISDPSILINTMVGRDNNYSFIGYLISPGGEKRNILIDRSHLSQSPLDVSKTRLAGVRRVLAGPYGQLGMVALLFIAVYQYLLKKGQLIGKN